MEEKNSAAQSLTALRNKKLSPKRRKEIASEAAKARWAERDRSEAELEPVKRGRKC
jgi:hypothetical protein